MDPVTASPDLQLLLLELVPNGAFWLALFGTFAAWWRSTAAHLCDLLVKGFAIADKFADNGLDVRLSITHLDGDPPGPTTSNREED